MTSASEDVSLLIVESTGQARGAQRAALHNGDVVRYTLSLLLAVVAEWSVFLGVLIYAFDRDGAAATGIASAAMLVPYIVAAPYAGRLVERHDPHRVRTIGLACQATAYGLATAAAVAELATVLVVAPTMVALAAVTTMGPAGGVLVPAIVRSSRELTVANLWAGYCESVSVFLGPLLAALMLVVGGASSVVAGATVLTAAATLVAASSRPPGGVSASPAELSDVGPIRQMHRHLSELRDRPGSLGVLAVAGGQFFLVGSLDIVMVVIAEEQLELGDAGAGWLLTLFGVGSFMSGVATTMLVNRRRLAPVLALGLAVTAAGVVLLGISTTLIVAVVILPVIGLTRATIDVVGHILLQRSAPPELLGPLFAMLEMSAGAGLLFGSLVAQILIAVSGTQAALLGTSGFFVALLALTVKSLRVADDHADVPVVAMSLLRRHAVFALLPRVALEAVARSGVELSVPPDSIVVAEGEVGDRFYAISDGVFDVTVRDEHVATLDRHGGSFGEIALLADVPRQATVTARGSGALLAIDREPFLTAVTGHAGAHGRAMAAIRAYGVDPPTRPETPPHLETSPDTSPDTPC